MIFVQAILVVIVFVFATLAWACEEVARQFAALQKFLTKDFGGSNDPK